MTVKALTFFIFLMSAQTFAKNDVLVPFEPITRQSVPQHSPRPEAQPEPTPTPAENGADCMKRVNELCQDARGLKACFDQKRSEFKGYCLGYLDARLERGSPEELFKDLQRECHAEIQQHCLYKQDLYAVSQCLQQRLNSLSSACRNLVDSTFVKKYAR